MYTFCQGLVKFYTADRDKKYRKFRENRGSECYNLFRGHFQVYCLIWVQFVTISWHIMLSNICEFVGGGKNQGREGRKLNLLVNRESA